MASASLSLILLVLVSSLALAISNDDDKCNNKDCCTSVRITCTATFVFGENTFYVVPYDTEERPGSMQVFNAACNGSDASGRYVGIYANTGNDMYYQSTKLEFKEGIITFSGNPSEEETVYYAIEGGTGDYTGITGTAKEVYLGEDTYTFTVYGLVC